MNEKIMQRLKDKVHALPGLPGVYKMFDIYGNIIYIGKAKFEEQSFFLFPKHQKTSQGSKYG